MGFHQDPEGGWVQELSCLHNQHVRHSPPFQLRDWVLTEEGRAVHLGDAVDCPLCQRLELPPDMIQVRRAGPFTEATLPTGLTRNHRVAAATWGLLTVRSGAVTFVMSDPAVEATLGPGDVQGIPPEVPHHLVLRGRVELTIDFLVRAGHRSLIGGPDRYPN
jgi:tellurite methyltransferase